MHVDTLVKARSGATKEGEELRVAPRRVVVGVLGCMLHLADLVTLVTPRSWLFSCDLVAAYHHCKVANAHRKYTGFHLALPARKADGTVVPLQQGGYFVYAHDLQQPDRIRVRQLLDSNISCALPAARMPSARSAAQPAASARMPQAHSAAQPAARMPPAHSAAQPAASARMSPAHSAAQPAARMPPALSAAQPAASTRLPAARMPQRAPPLSGQLSDDSGDTSYSAASLPAAHSAARPAATSRTAPPAAPSSSAPCLGSSSSDSLSTAQPAAARAARVRHFPVGHSRQLARTARACPQIRSRNLSTKL